MCVVINNDLDQPRAILPFLLSQSIYHSRLPSDIGCYLKYLPAIDTEFSTLSGVPNFLNIVSKDIVQQEHYGYIKIHKETKEQSNIVKTFEQQSKTKGKWQYADKYTTQEESRKQYADRWHWNMTGKPDYMQTNRICGYTKKKGKLYADK